MSDKSKRFVITEEHKEKAAVSACPSECIHDTRQLECSKNLRVRHLRLAWAKAAFAEGCLEQFRCSQGCPVPMRPFNCVVMALGQAIAAGQECWN
eukprot:1141046-Pelagomonas_calceolata.AAC.2